VIGFVVFVVVLVVLGGNAWVRAVEVRRLAERLGARRLLSRSARSLETADYVLDVIDTGWRVEVPRVRLGRRMVLTLQPGLKETAGMTTGFAEIDRAFRLIGDDPDLTSTVFADHRVREAVLHLRAVCRLRRVDLTAGETLVVLCRRRRKRSEQETVDAIVAVARALNDVADVKPTASSGSSLEGGVGGASGAPFAMPLR
jgi:hypothetical protein